MPAKHHFVPQFYLRRFSNAKKQIRIYERGHGTRISSVKNTAAQSGYYTAAVKSGGDPQGVEKLLDRIETAARGAIERIVNSKFPPSGEDRGSIGLFLAIQMMRTPERRIIGPKNDEVFLRLSAERMTRDDVKDIVIAMGLDLPTPL